MEYRFEIEHKAAGAVMVTCGDHQARDERALARKMVNAGAPDGVIEAGRAGRIDYRVRSLHAFAATALEEGENGAYVRTYRPHEKAAVGSALQHAIFRRTARVKNGVSGAAGIPPAPECVEKPSTELQERSNAEGR
jgi:hypothetical protein